MTGEYLAFPNNIIHNPRISKHFPQTANDGPIISATWDTMRTGKQIANRVPTVVKKLVV